ncbi:Protein madd-4 [Eumeta japonica]|uniref:Protein madd-4 n=1 Tax=Eumeta variegata TaxID=151549 RepID=A0A4C1YZG8_EUMVA|nr:Protein madd-4 [Eumeta japonica]
MLILFISHRSLTYGSSSNIRVAPGSPGKSYSWKEKGYTSCSASCLSGVQCVRDEDGKNASPYMCDPLTKPENRVRTCNDHPCPPRWNYTDFSQCTKSCGIGIQTREVTCIHEVTRGGTNTVVVPNSMCPQPPPPDRQYCNVLDCPLRWHTGDWTKCSKTCGGGIKDRKVECKQVMAQSHVVERPAALCNGPRPATTKTCNTRPCLLDTAAPEIGLANSSYIQHDPKKKKVTVKVGGSATIFYGTQVKIKCPVKGYNRTRIQWAKDHQIISKSKKYKISKKGALRITSLSLRDHHGVYTCVAGRSSANLTLLVKPRPGEFPSSEEIERHKALDEPSSPLADRTDARYRAMLGGTSDDQSHEQRPGDQRRNYKNRQRGGGSVCITRKGKLVKAKFRPSHPGLYSNRMYTAYSRTGKIDKVRDALYGSPATTSAKPSPSFDSRARNIYDENEESAISSKMLPPKGNSASRLLPCLHYLVEQLQTFGNSRGQRMVDPLVMYQNYESPLTRVVSLQDKQLVFPDDDGDIIIVNDDDSFQNVNNDAADDDNETAYVAEPSVNARFVKNNDSNNYSWMLTDWSPCTALCGQKGHQVRGATCQLKIENSTTTIEADECVSRGLAPPGVLKECEAEPCATWRVTRWSPPKCLSSGSLILRRRVECVRNETAVPGEQCDRGVRPEKVQKVPGYCRAVWATGAWTKCVGQCGGKGRQHRLLRCVWRANDRRGRRERGAGAACEGLPRPLVSRECRTGECVTKGMSKNIIEYFLEFTV